MCDEHGVDPAPPRAVGHPSRRTFLAGSAATVAALGLGSRLSIPAWAGTAPLVNDVGEQSRTMAMHIHASMSEGPGSMQAQLVEATRALVDVLWWTDHDWRMDAAGYRRAVHFDAPTGELEDGYPWNWVAQPTGKIASSGGGIVADPVSPLDPSAVAGALSVQCVGSSPSEASYRFYADPSRSRDNARSNVRGLSVDIEVYPQQIGTDAWLELLVSFSYRPAIGSRPAGQYVVSYRFGTAPAGYQTSGNLGIVWIPAPAGQWTSVQLTPEADIAALWPDIQATDNSFGRLWLGATSRNQAPCSGVFDYLRFNRTTVGADMYAVQAELMQSFAADFPSVLQLQGLELSYFPQHINWYGGTVAFENSATWVNAYTKSKVPYTVAAQQVADIHAGGGLATLNHPFGTGFGTGPANLAPTRHTIVSGLLGAMPALDGIEVGYQQRGATLRGHLDLWDTMLRNGWYLTGTGVSDDHNGDHLSWTGNKNRFGTGAWTGTLDEPSLVAAIASGRVYCRELDQTGLALDLVADGTARMGQVLVGNTDSEIGVTVFAPGLPSRCAVQVVQGQFQPGTRNLDPATAVVATLTSSDFSGDSATLQVDNSVSSYVRLEVVDPTGHCPAFSNPVWLLPTPPASPIPAARAAGG